MNFQEFAAQAIIIQPIVVGPHKGTDISEGAVVSISSDYPTRKYGVHIIQGPRGDTQNHIDHQVNHLRRMLATVMESVVEDCISTIEQQPDIKSAVKSLRDHFEMNPS